MLWPQPVQSGNGPLRILEFVQMLKCETCSEIQSLWEGGGDGGGLLLYHKALSTLLAVQAVVPRAGGGIKRVWRRNFKLIWFHSQYYGRSPGGHLLNLHRVLCQNSTRVGWINYANTNQHFSLNLKIESCLSQCWGNPARVFPHYLLVTAAPINWGKITKDEVSGDCLALWLQSEPFDEFLSSEIVWGESRYWAKEFNLYSQSLSLLETSTTFSSDKTHYGYVTYVFSHFSRKTRKSF